MGFLGILEDNSLPHVPGTVILNEESAHSEAVTAGLKHGVGKESHIVLVPQPSEDPNDPLNWSFSKKMSAFLITMFGTCLYASTFGPLLNAGSAEIAEEFGVSLTLVTEIGGYNLLVVGCTGPLVCALGRKYGKRPLFIFSALFGLIGTIIGATATGYETLLAGRVVQGLATSAYESLCVSMIGDIFFVHQRGAYMAFTQLVLGGVSNASSIITGVITTRFGWNYLFYILLAFVGAHIILHLLFVPETQYRRDHRYEIDELVSDDLSELAKTEQRHEDRLEFSGNEKLEQVTTNASTFQPPAKKSFFQEMALFTGTYSEENLIQLFLSPFAVCTNLAMLWVVIVSGAITAMYVAQAFVLAQIFFYPPYDLTSAGVGYLSTGPFIGGLVSAAVLSFTMDPIIKWATRKNKGVYEPEYRLLSNAGGLLAGAGLFLFGYLCQNHYTYYATSTVHGIVLFGVICVTASTSAYAVDAYREMSNEIFIMAMVFKNFLFYGYSYFINNWEAIGGSEQQFYTWGGVCFFLTATTPIIFIFGKRYRSFWARHNVMEALHIKTHAEL